jgi:hypothetical protein
MMTNRQLPERLRDGTPIHVRSEHFAEQCHGVITAAEYDDGWFYRMEVTAGDRLNAHRNDNGELWVCDFEVEPFAEREIRL